MNISSVIGGITGNAGVGGGLDVDLNTVHDGTDTAAKAGGFLGGDVGDAVKKVAGSAAAGATAGSVVPGFGTAIGAAVGAVVGLFESIGPNPHPGMDDAYWDVLGKKGSKGHEPTGQNISSDQLDMVHKYANLVTKHPNWQLVWPNLWQQLAHSDGAHSSLLANAVARYLHAPENGGVMVTPRMMADSIIRVFVQQLQSQQPCPTSDHYLVAAHAALNKAASEGPEVLRLVQEKVSLVEKVGLLANGLTAEVNSCNAAEEASLKARLKASAKPTPKPPVKVTVVEKSRLGSKHFWAETFAASAIAVGLAAGVHHVVSKKNKGK